ncbi:ATP-binding protein [Pseudalkalibacillus caeni]|uniref:Uncharacterized protein n=1 Tax=Exobacillus caeni TaxID=2574798 RepID=A0A5R9F6V2_9BACL|nr:hypothetical protein [Pseudalkalibacillus caeni]TLS38239.1 hypothetical protein FCL54_06805 [Pseudalkalibacillus caeni]
MNDKNLLVSMLKVMHRKLLFRHFSKWTLYALLAGSCLGFLIAVTGRLFVIPFLEEKLLWASFFVFVIVLVYSFYKRPGQMGAAIEFDAYTGEERVSTSLSCLEQENVMSELQRRDTVRHMKAVLPKIEQIKPFLFHPRSSMATGLLVILVYASFLFPNGVMEMAEKKEIEKETVAEAKKEVKKLAEKREQQKQANGEAKKLKKEMAGAETAEESLQKLLQTEEKLNKLTKEAETAERSLASLSEKAASPKLNQLSEALKQLDEKKVSEALKELKQKTDSLSEADKNALQEMQKEWSGKDSKSALTEEELQKLIENLEQSLEKRIAQAKAANQLAALQQNVQSIAGSLNNTMLSSNLPGGVQSLSFNNGAVANSGNNAGDNQAAQNSQQNSNGGKGNGNNSGSGKGSGTGTGNGNGSGVGQGSGSGTGNGSGSGGNGAGLGQGSREFLTVPERLNGDSNVETDKGELGEGAGEQQYGAGSPVLRGNLTPYREVYGSYEKAYRESVQRMQLPGYLEDVVKGYFSELDQEGEE